MLPWFWTQWTFEKKKKLNVIINWGFPTRMVYLANNELRVSDQNGISRLYIEGFWPEWFISTTYHCRDIIIYHSGRKPLKIQLNSAVWCKFWWPWPKRRENITKVILFKNEEQEMLAVISNDYKLVSAKVGMIIETIKFCKFMPVLMTLTIMYVTGLRKNQNWFVKSVAD